jgi:hypothetical protein
MGVQPTGSRRSARLANQAKGGSTTKYMIVRMAAPSTPATAAATRKYLFHKHVEHFIAEDFFEDRSRRRIVIDDITIDRETAAVDARFLSAPKGVATAPCSGSVFIGDNDGFTVNHFLLRRP